MLHGKINIVAAAHNIGVVLIDPQSVGDDVSLAVFKQGDHTVGIDRIGVDGVHVVALNNGLLKKQLTAFTAAFEYFLGGVLGHLKLADVVTAFAGGILGKNNVLAL